MARSRKNFKLCEIMEKRKEDKVNRPYHDGDVVRLVRLHIVALVLVNIDNVVAEVLRFESKQGESG